MGDACEGKFRLYLPDDVIRSQMRIERGEDTEVWWASTGGISMSLISTNGDLLEQRRFTYPDVLPSNDIKEIVDGGNNVVIARTQTSILEHVPGSKTWLETTVSYNELGSCQDNTGFASVTKMVVSPVTSNWSCSCPMVSFLGKQSVDLLAKGVGMPVVR